MMGIGGVAAAATLVAISCLSPPRRRRPRLVYRPSRLTVVFSKLVRYLVNMTQPVVKRQGQLTQYADSPELLHLKKMHQLLDIVEQFVLPLSCQGVVYGNPPHGAAIVHTDSMLLVAAASSEEHANPQHVPECLAIDCALEPQSSPASPPLTECLLLTTHILSSLAKEAVAASGIRSVYVLFPEAMSTPSAAAVASSPAPPTTAIPPLRSIPSESSQRLAEPAYPSGAQGTPPNNTCTSAAPYIPCPFSVSSFVQVVGSIPPGRRMFESQEEMERSLEIDSLRASAQTRLLVIGSIYQKLTGESEQ